MRQASLDDNKGRYNQRSARLNMDYEPGICYNVHIQSAIDHEERKVLKEMVEREIKASLQEDRGTYVVRGRVYDYSKRKYVNKSKSTGLKVKPGNKRKAESEMSKIVSAWREESISKARRGMYPTVSTLIELWLDRQKDTIRETTYRHYEVLTQYPLNEFGDMLVCDITRKLVQDYINREIKKFSRSTVCNRLTPLRGAMDYAVENDIIESNPLECVKVPKKPPKEQPVLSRDEIDLLMREALARDSHTLYTAIVLSGIYGLRRSEICGLRWIDIDFKTGEMSIRNIRTAVDGHEIELSGAKSECGTRTIKLTDRTLDYFKTLMQLQMDQSKTIDKVCCNKYWEPIGVNALSESMAKLMRDCGIKAHIHSLRHSSATMMSRELTVKQLQEFLGHSTPMMSLRYVHITDEDKNAIAESINKNSEYIYAAL